MEQELTNKKGFATKDFIIAGLLFTAVIIFFTIGVADMQGNYPNNTNIVDEGFQATYGNLTQQTDTIDTMRETSLSGEGLSFRGAFDVTFGSFFTIMQLTFGTLNLFGDTLFNITDTFPFIDTTVFKIFMTIALGILTTIIIFQLINAVGRNRV